MAESTTPDDQPRQLFEFRHGLDRFRCDLSDEGSDRVEAVFLKNDEVVIKYIFEHRFDPARAPREMAITWAGEWRTAIESGGHPPKSPLLQIMVMRLLKEGLSTFNRTRHPDGRLRSETEIREYDERHASGW